MRKPKTPQVQLSTIPVKNITTLANNIHQFFLKTPNKKSAASSAQLMRDSLVALLAAQPHMNKLFKSLPTRTTTRMIQRRFKRDINELTNGANQALRIINQNLGKILKPCSKLLFLSIDESLKEHYGKEKEGVTRSKEKASTTLFLGYLVFSLVHPGRQIIVHVECTAGRSQAKAAAEALPQVMDVLREAYGDDVRVIVVADGAYHTKEFLRACMEQGVEFIVRFNPRRRGLDYYRELLGDNDHVFFDYELSCCPGVVLRGVVVRERGNDDSNGRERIRVFLTHRSDLSAERVVSWYERRFRVENVFRACRGMLPRIAVFDAAWGYYWLYLSVVLYCWVMGWVLLKHVSFYKRGWFFTVVGLYLGGMSVEELRELVYGVVLRFEMVDGGVVCYCRVGSVRLSFQCVGENIKLIIEDG